MKKLTTYTAAIFMTFSMSSVFAEEGDMTQTRTETRTQASTGDAYKSQQGKQNQFRYNYRNNYQKKKPSMSKGSMSKQMNGSRSMGGGRR